MASCLEGGYGGEEAEEEGKGQEEHLQAEEDLAAGPRW